MTNKHEQLSFEEHTKADNEPVVCLGMTFKDDDERREYFRNELRKKLPELKKIEGFPIGEDEDIIQLSDPPYYTACPNPWINEFIEEWEKEKVDKLGRDLNEEYHIKPFTNDVKEGKNDPIYNAHSYHTKVPFKAIMRYILHYTNPGDVIYDGFAGSGMTGVAAQLCGDRDMVEELGYTVDKKGNIFELKKNGGLQKISKIGSRRVLLTELSTAASFMSHVYNFKTDPHSLQKGMESTMVHLKNKFTFLYTTLHNWNKQDVKNFLKGIDGEGGKDKLSNLKDKLSVINRDKMGIINYIVWSDVYICSNCQEEVNFYESTVDHDTKKVSKEMICPFCNVGIDRSNAERVQKTYYDKGLDKTLTIAKQVPVLINYSVNRKRFEKEPDKLDKFIINSIQEYNIPYWYPINKLRGGYNLDQPQRSHGISHIFQFYFKRTLLVISSFLEKAKDINQYHRQFILGSVLPRLTKMNRYMPQHGSRALVGPMTNVLYFPPMCVENNVLNQLERQMKRISKALNSYDGNIISTQSSTRLHVKNNSIDYIFLDPPFGANIMYSDLNFSRESWLKVITDNKEEAIENSYQDKGLVEYKKLMTQCLKESYRILKPGRWITVEFSNTKASVWNAIQSSLQESGFIIASVDALDKTRGGLFSMITPIGVKQDLIITAYKPQEVFKEVKNIDTEFADVYNFVKNHLGHLPISKGKGEIKSFITERDPRIIYDRMVAYFISREQNIPVSSPEFQERLFEWFSIRDGMVFLESQVSEYDKKNLKFRDVSQLNLFVSDETSAIEWLRQQLMKKPQTRQDIHPNFMKEIQHIEKHELLPELDDLLNQNFLIYDGDGAVPDQIVAYFRRNYKNLRGLEADDEKVIEKAMNRWYVPDPNKQADLERLRERALLREFEGYLQDLEGHRRQLRQFRTEAVRAGFKKAYSDRNFEQIVQVGDRLPKRILEADDKLLMYYDNASIRLGM